MPADLNDYFNKRKPSGNDGDKEPKINFKSEAKRS